MHMRAQLVANEEANGRKVIEKSRKRTGSSERIYTQLYTKYAGEMTGRKGPVKSWTFGGCWFDRLMAIAERSPTIVWVFMLCRKEK